MATSVTPSLYADEVVSQVCSFDSQPSTSKLERPKFQSCRSGNSNRDVNFDVQQVPSSSSPVKEKCSNPVDKLSEELASVKPAWDWNFLSDDRLLRNLLKLENCQRVRRDYLNSHQNLELKPFMRKMTVEWMFDVCDEQQADMEVLAVAVRLMDRFLGLQPIFKQQLQGLATACLFLASKLKQPAPFAAPKLVDCTDNSMSLGELMSWELLLLNKLDWDVACVTAFDFVEHLLCRSNIAGACVQKLRHKVHEVITQVQSDHEVAFLPPSIQACICIVLGATATVKDREQTTRLLQGMEAFSGINRVHLFNYASAVESCLLLHKTHRNCA